MRAILSDLVAEEQAFDQLLQSIDVRKWNTRTPAGWQIRDHVAYLAGIEDYAGRALLEPAAKIGRVLRGIDSDQVAKEAIVTGRRKRPQDVIEWWRASRATVVSALAHLDGSERIPWMRGKMSAKSFASGRLAETWAHGLDVRAAAAQHGLDSRAVETQPPADTPRLRHVGHLSWLALPYAFEAVGEEYRTPIRLDLSAPGYQRWSFGAANAREVVRGDAVEWCRVAAQRIKAEETSLIAEGETARTALRVARMFV